MSPEYKTCICFLLAFFFRRCFWLFFVFPQLLVQAFALRGTMALACLQAVSRCLPAAAADPGGRERLLASAQTSLRGLSFLRLLCLFFSRLFVFRAITQIVQCRHLSARFSWHPGFVAPPHVGVTCRSSRAPEPLTSANVGICRRMFLWFLPALDIDRGSLGLRLLCFSFLVLPRSFSGCADSLPSTSGGHMNLQTPNTRFLCPEALPVCRK